MTEELAPPRRRLLPLEARAAIDLVRMTPSLLAAQIRPRVAREASPILVVPGFGSGDLSTAPLRHYLERLGYRAEGWGLGRNLAGIDLPHSPQDLSSEWDISTRSDFRGETSVPYLCDRLVERLLKRRGELGESVTLIGWSLGGYLAREAARDLPDFVDRVITLGSPTIGGPKYTAAAPFFRKRGMDLDWIEAEIEKREARPIRQPITAIFSKSDAIVSWRAAMDRYSENVRHIEVRTAHVGMGFDPTVWKHVLAALEDAPSRRPRSVPIRGKK